MRYLIMMEQTEEGFAVQVPDLAVITHGRDVEEAKAAAALAIRVNLEAYGETGMPVPPPAPVKTHLDNPDFDGLLFAFVDVDMERERAAA